MSVDLVSRITQIAELAFDILNARKYRVPREIAVAEAVEQCWIASTRFDPERGTEKNFYFRVCQNEFQKAARRYWGRRTLHYEAMPSDVQECHRLAYLTQVRKGRGGPIPLSQHAEVLEMHADGWYNAQIARSLGVHQTTVHNVLKQHGKRTVGYRRIKRIDVLRLTRQGLTPERIAEKLVAHPTTVTKILKKHNEVLGLLRRGITIEAIARLRKVHPSTIKTMLQDEVEACKQ